MVWRHLGFRAHLVQVSPWGVRPLTLAQLRYAALDAHVAVLVRSDLKYG